jgi:molybdopterin synthase catalytic subunit
MADTVRAIALREEPLRVDEVQDALADPGAGGLAMFVGTVRDHDGGKSVEGLTYTAHPSALDRMRDLAEKVAATHGVIGVAAVHRVGELAIGDIAVVVGVCAAHRGEAIDACRDLIDELKATVPIWKHQRFSDGTDEWVGTP